MTKPRGTDPAGRPVDLIGQTIRPGRGSVPTLLAIPTEGITMAKAESTGTYTLNGNEFVIRAGDPIPEGAEYTAAPKADDGTDQRAQKAAPENKAKQSAPETKAR